jgi:hypothetical protein
MNIAVLYASLLEDNRDDAGLIEGRLSREGVNFFAIEASAGRAGARCLFCPRQLEPGGGLDMLDLTICPAS